MNLVDLITEAARYGVQINIYRTQRGSQVSIKRRDDAGWTVYIDRDPVVALREALKQRVLKGAVAPAAAPAAPAAVASPGFEDLFG